METSSKKRCNRQAETKEENQNIIVGLQNKWSGLYTIYEVNQKTINFLDQNLTKSYSINYFYKKEKNDIQL